MKLPNLNLKSLEIKSKNLQPEEVFIESLLRGNWSRTSKK